MTTKKNPVNAFVKAVTQIPAKGFSPIIPSKSVEIDAENDNWHLSFYLEQNAKVAVNLIYAWIPKAYRCYSVGFSNGIMTVGIQRR